MTKNRRDFLKKAALGSAVISSGGGFSVLDKMNTSGIEDKGRKISMEPAGDEMTNPPWKIFFNEASSSLSLSNGPVIIEGQLTFLSGNNKWTIVRSRDGINERLAIVDALNNVQGYIKVNPYSDILEIIFYHRTAQAYEGILTFSGNIDFTEDSFPCRTRANAGERVLSLSYGLADSMLNDSLFSPQTDILFRIDAANLSITAGHPGTYRFIMSGHIHETSRAVFGLTLEQDYFKKRYVPYYNPLDRERCCKTPTGWMSWNTYFDKATADDNLNEAKIGQKYLQPFGCEFWSIESWQGNSDQLPVRNFHNMNLEVNEKQFPKGMKQLAHDIRKTGFRPGLWTAPFGTGNKEFYEAHKNWFLHDKDGKPVSSWNGIYTLDPTVPEARDHLKEIHRIASRDWGYEFFKIDGMSGRNHGYCAHLYERPEIRACFNDPSCRNPFELCIQAFREGIGEDRVLLACQGHTSGPEPLYADASRIGADIVHPGKPVEWSNVLNQGRCTINQAFTHNIVLINDPDTLLVRDLPLEEARVTATIVALPGQLTFFGDKLAGLPDERMKMLQQTLPAAYIRPMNLYPYFSMLPVWNLHVKNPLLDDYNVVALFNWEDKSSTISFSVAELGINPYSSYLLYEFWTQESYNTITEQFALEIPPRSVRLFTLHKEKPVPQWISSDRHVTQTAMELKDYTWNPDRKALEGRIQLISDFPLTMRLRAPKNYAFSNAVCSGVKCSTQQEKDNITAVTFLAGKSGDYNFSIKF